MPLGRSGPEVGWRPVVAAVLPGLWSERRSYQLRAVADEIAVWAERAPLSAWDRKRNAESLLLDLRAARAECGLAVQSEIDATMQPILDALRGLSGRKSDRSAVVGQLNKAAQVLLVVLIDPAARMAAWSDLVDAGGAEPLDPALLTARVDLLMELIAGVGGYPGEVASDLVNIVWPSSAAVLHDPDAAPEDWTDRQRVDAGTALVRESGQIGQCVVWVDFHEARIPGVVTELGRVTLFDAEWCIGNSIGPPDQDFQFKQELVEAWDLRSRDEPNDSAGSLGRQVIARVDLGERSTHRAVEDAEQTVAALNVIIPALTGAPGWQRGERSSIVLDGIRVQSGWGPPRGPWPEPDYYGLNGFSDALDERRDLFTRLLSQPLPVDVAEALRLINEAGQVDSRENELNRTATITDRSVIVLQVSALERLAVFSGLSSEDFGSRLAALWPDARYWSMVRHAVTNAVGDRGGSGDELSGIYTYGKHGRKTNLRLAYQLRQPLIDGCKDRVVAAQAASLVSSLGDAPAAFGIIDALHDEATRLYERVLRCRNALVHGNPVSDSAVVSVRPFVRYMVDSALNMTLDILSSGSTLPEVLEANEHRAKADASELTQGHSYYDMWTMRLAESP